LTEFLAKFSSVRMSLSGFPRSSRVLSRLLSGGVLGLSMLLVVAPAVHAQGEGAHKKAVVSKKKAPRAASQVAKGPRQPARATKASLVAARPSFGQMAGLHAVGDPLDLAAKSYLLIDVTANQVLATREPDMAVEPASLTKLMTGLVVAEANLPMSELITISQDDVDTEKGSSSRLRVGTTLTRDEALHLALMSSENRAAHALGRTYPGGLMAFVSAMNAKAKALGMASTTYVEPTGLSSANQSSALDLSILVRAASEHALIWDLSTASDARVAVGRRELEFRNTNGLIRNPEWDIGLQKTGYISEAGRCVVMQAQLAGRQLIMVLLDSAGRYSRIGDAERLRNWVAASIPAAQAAPWSSTGR